MSSGNNGVPVLAAQSPMSTDGHAAATNGSSNTVTASSSIPFPATAMTQNSVSVAKSPVSPTSRPEPALPPELQRDGSKSDLRDGNGVVISFQNSLNESADGDVNGAISAATRSSSSKVDKPPITIPAQMANTDATSPKGTPPISRRASKYASGGIGSRHNSVSSLTPSRPAPPSPSSPASRTASRDVSRRGSRVPSLSRKQSQTSERTQQIPSHKASSSSMRRVSNSTAPAGLMFTATRRLSGLFNTFTSDDLPDSTTETKTMDSPLERIGEGVPSTQTSTSQDQSTSQQTPSSIAPTDQPTASTTTQPESAISRNLSSASAATSGSSSSTPSNPAARHASELEAIYAQFALQAAQENEPTPIETPAPAPAADEDITQSNTSMKSTKTVVDMGDDELDWHRAHPIIVRDFAFQEDDSRFSSVPIELLPMRERAKVLEANKGKGKATGYGGGYGARYRGWDVADDADDDEDDDDGWGFPMGTVSGGAAPLGTRGGGPRGELRNRTRAWNGLGARGVGGRWGDVSQSEEESSGFYEESGEEELSFGPQDGIERPEEDEEEEDYIANTHTPSNVRSHFDFLHVQPHPEVDGMDGVLGDEDSSPYTSDHPPQSTLPPGIYRALFDFLPEGDNEMGVSEGQLVKVLGRGNGEGWAVVVRGWSMDSTNGSGNDEEAHGLVPESYLEVYQLEDDELN